MTGASPSIDQGRTLPLGIEPVPGEAFDSWTERIAAALGVEHAEALFAIGAISEPNWRGFAGFWNVMLPAERVAEIARRCRLSVDQVAATLLASYHGRALDCSGLAINNRAAYRLFVQRSPFLSSYSRLCPDCLGHHDGAWMLRWRLPWSFACTTHGCLLLDDCPHCQAPLRTPSRMNNRARFIDQIPRPGHCTNPASAVLHRNGRARPCSHDLRDVPAASLAGNEPVLNAQQHLDTLLRDGTGSVAGRPMGALEFYHDLAILARLVMHLTQPDDRPVADVIDTAPSLGEWFTHFASERDRQMTPFHIKTPLSSPVMAVAIAVALPILAAPDPDSAGVHLRWLIEVAYQRRRATATHLKHNWGVPSPVLSSLFEEGFSDVAGYSRGFLPPRAHRCAKAGRHVPQLAWAELYDSHFGALLNHTPALAGRAITAVCIAKALEHSTWPDAAQVLGLDSDVGRVATAVTKRLERDGRLDAYSQGIRTVVSMLDSHTDRIDFAQRRDVLDDPRVLQPYVNQALAGSPFGLLDERQQTQRLIAIWLWATITGGYPRHTTGWARLEHHERHTYPRFCATDAIALAATLDDAAAKLLAERGLTGPIHPTSMVAQRA